MNNFRIDLILIDLLSNPNLGVEWLLLGIALVAVVGLARLDRALMTMLLVLVCTQVWWFPLLYTARRMRWFLLLVLCIRGLVHLARTRPVPGEPRVARNFVIAMGCLALASVSWSTDALDYTLAYSVSFCLGLLVAFGLLWRLCDSFDLLQTFARSAMVLSLVLFGGGYIVAGVAYLMRDEELFRATWISYDRYRGLFYNPNSVGLIAAILLPMIVAAPRATLGRLASLRLLVIVLTLTTIFLSGSRSALIGSALALLIIALYRFGAGAILTILLAGVLIATGAIVEPVENFDETVVGHISRTKHLHTLSGRTELWAEGWAAAQDHMMIGQGWGHSRALGGIDTELAAEAGEVAGASNLHNAHLQLLIDVGVLGIALFWPFCLCVIAAGWRILRAPRTPENAIGVVMFTSVLGLLADTWVHGGIWSMGSPTTVAFWALCALVLKQGARATWGTAAAAPEPAARSHVEEHVATA